MHLFIISKVQLYVTVCAWCSCRASFSAGEESNFFAVHVKMCVGFCHLHLTVTWYIL